VQLILTKHVQGVHVGAYFLYAYGIVFVAIAILGHFKEPRIFMPHLLAAVLGIVLIISGAAYHRVASTRAQRPNQSKEPTASRRYI
jgi:hypothetical protein